MASAKDFLGTSAINAEVIGDKPVICKIMNAAPESINGQDPKLALDLDKFPDRKLLLNKTNLKRLMKAFGDDYLKWKGKIITVQSEDCEYMGQPTKGVRVLAKK